MNYGKIDEKVHGGVQEANNMPKRGRAEYVRTDEGVRFNKASINTWVRQFTNSGKFGIVENLSENEKELRILRKENKQLRMENDILKQAALILGQRNA